MSRIYWHTRERTAELNGSERYWLESLACGPAEAAWDVDELDRVEQVLAMVSHDGAHGYLRQALRDAQRAQTGPHGDLFAKATRAIRALRLALRVQGLDLDVAGHRLRAANIGLNTALVAGSDPVRLAAKVGGWCEFHCWVDGPDRGWLAGIIDDALDAGLYRRALLVKNHPADPSGRILSQGWEDVLDLLRESGDGPVVLSHSCTEWFPNHGIADWEPPPMPADYRPDLTESDREDYYADEVFDQWDALPVGEQWDQAVVGLKRQRPWAQLTPGTLATVSFGPPVTVYDLFALDRDERVRAAVVAPVAVLPPEPTPEGR